MTTPRCSAPIIPARWFRLALWTAAAAMAAAAAARPPAKRPASHRPAAKRTASATPGPRDLASLVRAYRAAPAAARRAAIVSYAASHPKESALAKLALGVAAFEREDWAGAVGALATVAARLPQLADHAAWRLQAARLELKDASGVSQGLEPVRTAAVVSPYLARSRVLEARALLPAKPAEALRILREHAAGLPQPEGDLAMAEAYQAAGDLARAALHFQRVYCLHPVGEASAKAAAAMLALRDVLGDAYPAVPAELALRRGEKLVELREYARARTEYQSAAGRLAGVDRDRARVRAAAVDVQRGQAKVALAQLRGMDVERNEADAERLYWVAEACRRLKEDDAMLAAVEELGQRHAASPWRMKALVSAANRYLLANRPDRYVPLYQAARESFPDDPQAPFSGWKAAFAAHMARERGAEARLREHVRRYPGHSTAASAMYFLGGYAEAEGDRAAARTYYLRIAGLFPNQYYALLARQRLARPAVAAAGPSEKTERFLADVAFPARKAPALDRTPATAARLERAKLLRAAGLDDLSEAELRFGARADGQPWLLAIDLASHSESSYLGLRAMKSLVADYLNVRFDHAPRKLWELLFPLPWQAEVAGNAAARSLDPHILAGLIRQESEFNPKAVSRAKAYGLTQVRPPTGRQFARKAGVARVTTATLVQPSANLKLGATILKAMLDQHGGKWELTLAAYNAGPSRVKEWLTWNTYREPAEFIESIPFTETREYVQAVLRNAELYRRIYGREPALRAAAEAR